MRLHVCGFVQLRYGTTITTRIQRFCESAKHVTKYGFTLTKIMREGTLSHI
jgi:hypothetical protein